MKVKQKKKLNEKPFFVDDEREEMKAEIARLRGALRAIQKMAKLNLSWTPSYMLKLEGASHAADAFRTAAVMIREPERKKRLRAAW